MIKYKLAFWVYCIAKFCGSYTKGEGMKNYRQNGLNVAAGILFLAIALFRVVGFIDTMKVVSQYFKYEVSMGWGLWTVVIADAAILILFALAGISMLSAKTELYSKVIIGAGSGILLEYLVIIVNLFSAAGRSAGSIMFYWRMILV